MWDMRLAGSWKYTYIPCLGEVGTRLRGLPKAELNAHVLKTLLGSRLMDLPISKTESLEMRESWESGLND